MKISYNWLKELVPVRSSPAELAERLTRVGLAVEFIEKENEDFILDFDLTSNRPDCLSHLGIAREAAVIEGTRVNLPKWSNPPTAGKIAELTSVEIVEPELCPRYSAKIVRGVKIGPSPDWLVRRLESIGQRSVNNVADITNYVMHELGQPLHAFDLNKLAGRRIVVRRAGEGERLTTLDGVERQLTPSMLVIADAERAVALAGVMGGENTEISDETVDVLIESAHFSPDSVRLTARELGLHTEASHRFERGVDPEGVLRAQDRCVSLICELAGGTAAEGVIDVYPLPYVAPLVGLRPERIEDLTGLEVPEEDAHRYLTGLGFNLVADSVAEVAQITLADGSDTELHSRLEPYWTFESPSWRFDIAIEEDLVEEVARHFGFDKIKSELAPGVSAGEYQPMETKKRAVRQALTSLGFDEAINFSFISSEDGHLVELLPRMLERSGGQPGFVQLANPIIEGASLMRPSLLPGLLHAIKNNLNKGTRDVRLFETGRIFALTGSGDVPEEIESLGIVLTGTALEAGRVLSERALDFFDLKGAVEATAAKLRLPELTFAPANVKHLREGQSASISCDGIPVGFAGRLDESIAAAYKFKQPVYVCELDLAALVAVQEEPIRYQPLPRYPSVVRDISLIVDRRVGMVELINAARGQQIEVLRNVGFVATFEGGSVPEGRKSVTLRLEYRSNDRTLRDEDVEAMHQQVVRAFETEFGASIRH